MATLIHKKMSTSTSCGPHWGKLVHQFPGVVTFAYDIRLGRYGVTFCFLYHHDRGFFIINQDLQTSLFAWVVEASYIPGDDFH
jgi:hypothetical protein